jgi:uncharacterized protein YjbJ (UPF0337 family)
MLNQDGIKGKWLELKGEILTQWGKLTDDEVDQTQGNVASIAGLIQQKYGAKKEEIHEKLEGIMSRFTDKTGDVKEKLRKDPETH